VNRPPSPLTMLLSRHTRRREFVVGFAGTLAYWPRASAQQVGNPVIGFLNGGSPEGYARMTTAFRRGLEEAGFVDGKNVLIEYRWAEGQFDQLPALAADLLRRPVDLIAATSTPAALAVRAATRTVPVVFTTSSDPVQLGLVSRLSGQGEMPRELPN
jgi:putative tryptophan/tyrosine transport system substrate-binding protein